MFLFTKRDSRNHIESVLRRIVDRTTPNLTPQEGEIRTQNRYNRSLPVLLTPQQGKTWAVEQSIGGLTKDISDVGLSVILTQPIGDNEQVAVTLWLSTRQATDKSPSILRGRCCHCVEFGGGFWQVGLELSERLESDNFLAQILPQAWHLLPAASQAELLEVEQ